MVYRFVSLVKKVSSKGNNYGRVVFVDLNGNVNEVFVYDTLLSRIDSFKFKFGDYVNIDCDLKGIVNIESYEGVV